jgi:hypothetical protein
MNQASPRCPVPCARKAPELGTGASRALGATGGNSLSRTHGGNRAGRGGFQLAAAQPSPLALDAPAFRLRNWIVLLAAVPVSINFSELCPEQKYLR